jgi:hypothetical protein
VDDGSKLGNHEVQRVPEEDLDELVLDVCHIVQEKAYQVGVVGHVAARSLIHVLGKDKSKSGGNRP